MVRLKTALTNGLIFGFFALLYTVMECITLFVVVMLFPESEIDILPSFNCQTSIETESGELKQYCDDPQAFGDHLFSVGDLQTNRHDFSGAQARLSQRHSEKYNRTLKSPVCKTII